MKLGQVLRVAQGDWYIIPRYEAWLYRGSRDLDRQAQVIAQIMDRPKRVRTNTFSASSAGQCLRRRQLAYLGYPQEKPTAQTMNIFVNGDFLHLRHQVAGLMEGYLTGAEVSVAKVEYRLTGTMDGVADDDSIAEYKSINSRGFSQVSMYGAKTEHVEQTHSYMLASDRDIARVVYENKDTNELKEFAVHRNAATMKKVVQDLEILNEATEAESLLPMQGECVEGRGAYRSCPVREVCPLAKFAPYESPRRTIRVRSSTPSA